MKNEVDQNARVIWEYMLMHHELTPADAIMALGTNTTLVAERAADLFLARYAPLLIFSGDSGAKYGYARHFEKPEAEVFAEVAIARGVPEDKILIENKSANTGENMLFVRKLLAEKGIVLKNIILVQKPYMERRTYATFKQQWAGLECQVTSPLIDYDGWVTVANDFDAFINTMVGDLQRIIEYPAIGLQIFQEVPESVLSAYNQLVELGFTKRIIKLQP